MSKELLYVLLGTGFTFFATALGSAVVFFFKNDIKPTTQKLFLGFAAGVMTAASVWSLLIPAIDIAKEASKLPLIPVCGGFIIGVGFLMLLDTIVPHLHIQAGQTEGLKSNLSRSAMLFSAVTLHNIPEGMAVGVAFVMAAKSNDSAVLAGAITLAIGMGLQNFPEGAALSLPLRKEGFSKMKSFVFGALSGIVEPLGGIVAIFLIDSVSGIMPWVLSFAAGAMIFVVIEELVPESRLDTHSHTATLSYIFGFLLMMSLDVSLG